MKRFLVLLSVISPLGLTACSKPEVTIEAAISQEGSDAPVALADLPVQLLPYDRDAIFDSLTAAASTPEPAIPAEILQQQEEVQAAQTAWRAAEERWTEVRDSLRVISEQTQQLQSRGLRNTPQYQQMFQQFGRLESEEQRVKQQMDQAFARFDQLQRSALAQADSIRVVREAWAEGAYADFDRIVAARYQAAGIDVEVADTTNANGLAAVRAPKSGRWWVHARYMLPYQELYWNVPVELTSDSTHVVLNRENAEVRPVM